MGRFVVRLGTKYVEWSTIVDAPVTFGLTRAQLTEYIHAKYGEDGLRDLPGRMERVDLTGTSEYPDGYAASAEATTACNRAGDGELALSFAELVALYDGGARDRDVCLRSDD